MDGPILLFPSAANTDPYFRNTGLAIISDIEKGLDPFTRRRAAPESGVESVS
jgi:hypothetical protein